MSELKIPLCPSGSFSFLKRTKKLSLALGCFLIVGLVGSDSALSKEKDDGSVTSSPADELFVPSEKDIQESGPPMMIPTAGDGGSMGGGDVETITIPGGKRGTMGGGDLETIDVPSGGHDVETITIPGGNNGSWQQPGSGSWSPPANSQPPSWSAPTGAGQGPSWQQWSDMVNKTQGQPAPKAAPPSWGVGAPAQTWGTPPQQGWNAASPPANWNAAPPANWNTVPNGPPPGWGAPPVTQAPVVPPLAVPPVPTPPATAAAITAPAAAPASPDLGSTLLTGFLNWAASATKPAAAATGTAAPAAPAAAGTPATGSVLVPAITVPAITLPAITLPAISLPADIPGAIANSMKNMAPKTPDTASPPAGTTPAAGVPPAQSGFPPAANGYPSAPPGYPVPPGFAPSASGYPPAWGSGQMPAPVATGSPWPTEPGAPPKPAGVADDIMDTPLADSLLGPGGQRNLSSPNAVGRVPPRPAPSLLDNVFGSRGLASPGANGMINYLLGPRGLNTGVRLRLR